METLENLALKINDMVNDLNVKLKEAENLGLTVTVNTLPNLPTERSAPILKIGLTYTKKFM